MNLSQTKRAGDAIRRERLRLIRQINLKLASLGQPVHRVCDDVEMHETAEHLVRVFRQQRRLLSEYQCPVDSRIQGFIEQYLNRHQVHANVPLPLDSFMLDQPGMARELSLPAAGDHFGSGHIDSYRIPQGVLHNPSKDRRTTKGVFHIVEGGLPIPTDKKAVPVAAFARLLEHALEPPADLLELPFTSDQTEKAHSWVSLYLRPRVVPAVGDDQPARSMETRFFAPGGLVANLDFVERIFGNAGDPFLPENDAGLDVTGWTGTSGCVILAPHLIHLSKQTVGLPRWQDASERQRRDGMCWLEPDELYNDGQAFKLVCRDSQGVIFTLIADNYFGYSKKEIKSQISYSANVIGGAEEEHAGGALAFPRYNLGDVFQVDDRIRSDHHNLAEAIELLGDRIEVRPEGYAIDRRHPEIIYVPEDVRIDLQQQRLSWSVNGREQCQELLAERIYVHPCGYKVRLEKNPNSPTWRLVGTEAEGTFCHKPCTVSGGGKSEISKSISGALLSGPFYIGDFKQDLDAVQRIFDRDYSDRFRSPQREDKRPLLSDKRSLGSVIRLLTPSDSEYTDAYNSWLTSIPQHIRALVFIIKRLHSSSWGTDWRRFFSVDRVNGYPGNELRFLGRKLVGDYLRVGLEKDESWRLFKVRQDFVPAHKLQMEDDISVSTTVAAAQLDHLAPEFANRSVKLIENCEEYLFQRPDDAVVRGADRQTEMDLSGEDNFISNFEPLTRDQVDRLVSDAVGLDKFSKPMQDFIRRMAENPQWQYLVSSAHPRLVNGRPSPNMRYLQRRPDRAEPRDRYLAEIGLRLYRRIPADKPVYLPVDAVLSGRRNNPSDRARGIRPLAVYNPIHYQELPELFMDFIASLTGKSPSTTGAGSEGALTKGPFNALSTTADLNAALLSFILGDYQGFSSAAGHVGEAHRVDHDISMLVPEIWCRIPPAERDATFMIERGYLEKLEDFEYQGDVIVASRLGYRITERFVHAYFGRIFDNPLSVFDESMLKPETYDLAAFVDGIRNITEAQQQVAQAYLDDSLVEDACPPLQALLTIMATGHYQGQSLDQPEIRRLFTREYVLSSPWYRERLELQRDRELRRTADQLEYLKKARRHSDQQINDADELPSLIGEAEARLARISAPDYVDSLVGGVGADWLHRPAVQSGQANDSPSQQRPSRTSHADTVGVVA